MRHVVGVERRWGRRWRGGGKEVESRGEEVGKRWRGVSRRVGEGEFQKREGVGKINFWKTIGSLFLGFVK